MVHRSAIRGLCLLLCALAAGNADAGPFSDLFVFGDSLSDVGNTSASTFGIEPGSGYFDGRFSNGPVYAERLATGLGLGPLTRSETGGGDFAYGGAETDGPGGFSGLFVDSLVEQVDEYVDRAATAPPDADALFVVFIGANDLFGGQTNVSEPIGVVTAQLGRLVGAGARTFLGINLPRLGLTPDFNGDAASAAAITATSEAYNDALAQVYDQVESTNAGVAIHRLDLKALFSGLIDTPSQWGFTNTTGRGQDASGGVLDGAPGYVFWDGVHPTREAHALLGEAAVRAVLPPGDFDRDGDTTAADYDAWRLGYGARFDASLGQTTGVEADANGDGRVDAADYSVWRDALASAPAALPEPTAVVLIVSWLTTAAAGRDKSSRREPWV